MTFAWLDATQLQILAVVAGAMILGGVIGLEREMREKAAGLKTHMLVAGAAALLVSLDRMIVVHFTAEFGSTSGVFRADPIGVVQAVVTGVAFLGAGTIIRGGTGEHIEGLTTAASLLFTATLGICAGLSLWLTAVGGTVLALFTLRVVPVLERRLRLLPRAGPAATHKADGEPPANPPGAQGG